MTKILVGIKSEWNLGNSTLLSLILEYIDDSVVGIKSKILNLAHDTKPVVEVKGNFYIQ